MHTRAPHTLMGSTGRYDARRDVGLTPRGQSDPIPRCATARLAASLDRKSEIRNQKSAFTLVELIVVVGIISLLLGLGAASVKQLVATNRTNAGLKTVEAALASTRAQVGGNDRFEDYQGMALLFTPSDLRIVRHVDSNPDGTPLKNGSGGDLRRQYKAYADVADVDYVHMPKGSAVVGIARSVNSDLSGLRLLTPPFALRFDQNGQLIARQGRPIYYDGDYDEQYSTSAGRDPGYTPQPFDSGSEEYDRSATSVYNGRDAYDFDANKPVVPFEKIETVVGVLVYDKEALLNAGHNLDASSADSHPISAGARKWLLNRVGDVEDGDVRLLLFNRYTGERFARNR